MSKNKLLKIVIIVIAIVIIVDQLSKFLIEKNVTERIGTNQFAIEIVHNTGMAFGFASGNTKNIVLSILVLFIMISFIKNQINEIDTKTLIAISLVMGGGISNLIDRFFRGGILDFIKVLFIPNFNIADVCICIGWVLLVIFLILYTQQVDVIKEEK